MPRLPAVGVPRADRGEALLPEAWRIRETADVGAFIRRWFDGR